MTIFSTGSYVAHYRRDARSSRIWRGALLRVLSVAGFVSLDACWPTDASQGTFNLTATGGIEIVSHGTVSAQRPNDLTGIGYSIDLDVANGTPPMTGFLNLGIATEKRPIGDVRFVDGSRWPNNAEKTAWIVLGRPSGMDVDWLTDSGSVDFKRVPGRHAVAGEFVAYMSCPRCGPGNTPSRAVLRGNFETRDRS